MTLYLKWTTLGRVPSYQGGTPIPLNRWTRRVTNPILCERGWHACRWEDAIYHIAAELWVCELDGKIVEGDDKVVGERLRLVEQVPIDVRLWAVDIAEHVLPIFEADQPGDGRPRETLAVTRRFLNGDATLQELQAASAAGAAAWAAAWAAADASAAAWAAWAARDAAAWAAWAARAAARAAAEAAGAAARAARAAEQAWQTDRLLVHYGHLDPTLYAHKPAT